MDNLNFSIIENGKKVNFEIIKFFNNPFTHKKYLIYKEEESEDVFASQYEIIGNRLTLNGIYTDAEWDSIDKALEGVQ